MPGRSRGEGWRRRSAVLRCLSDRPASVAAWVRESGSAPSRFRCAPVCGSICFSGSPQRWGRRSKGSGQTFARERKLIFRRMTATASGLWRAAEKQSKRVYRPAFSVAAELESLASDAWRIPRFHLVGIEVFRRGSKSGARRKPRHVAHGPQVCRRPRLYFAPGIHQHDLSRISPGRSSPRQART